MKVTLVFFYLVSVLIVSSCAAKNNNIQYNGNKLIIENGIEIEKAKLMVSEFLNQEKANNIHGNISIKLFEEKYRKECLENPIAKEYFKEFCNSHYVITYSAEPKCRGGSRVIERCERGSCNYRISEYSEVCE